MICLHCNKTFKTKPALSTHIKFCNQNPDRETKSNIGGYREGSGRSKSGYYKGIYCGSAIKLGDGMIITGKNSPIFHSESSCILNALKYLAGIPDEIHLINPEILKQVSNMKAMMLDHNSPSLSVSEMLIVLASSANDNGEANKAINMIGELRDCEMHSSVILSSKDLSGLRDLGINITSDPVFVRNQ